MSTSQVACLLFAHGAGQNGSDILLCMIRVHAAHGCYHAHVTHTAVHLRCIWRTKARAFHAGRRRIADVWQPYTGPCCEVKRRPTRALLQGPVELERDPEAEEEQRQQGPKRAPRLRPPAGAQAAKASKQQAAGAAAVAAAAAGMVTAVAVGAGDATAVGTDGMSSPQRAGGGKRRADSNQAQLACKKRKQVGVKASLVMGMQTDRA